MPQSLSKILIHLVFSTKYRYPWLDDCDLRENLYAYQHGILKTLQSPSIIINGTADHLHLLLNLSRNHPLKLIVQEVKSDSSAWLKTQADHLSRFRWQRGYGAFSVTPSRARVVQEYIRNQQSHHATEDFQDEFRRLCRQNGVEWDERYVWD